MSYSIPLIEPMLGGREAANLAECVATNYVSSVGPFVNEFEERFAKYVGAGHAVAVSTGTAAIHLALLTVGVGDGDEVWVSDLTFIASANPVLYCGARVTLIDSERGSWNADPALIVRELDRRTTRSLPLPRAIVAVDVLGHPADLGDVVERASELGVAVVEDATEALGAAWTAGALKGRQCGRGGTVGCYSFNGNKLITTGGGGMIVTDDSALADRMRHLSTQARLPGVGYSHDAVGFNYRLTNIAAALGVAQLEQLDGFLVRKREIARTYDAAVRGVAGVSPAPNCNWADRSAWLYSVLFDTSALRDRAMTVMHDAGIEVRPIWYPVHRQGPYLGTEVLGAGAVADDLADRALSLPSSVGLSADQQRSVIACLLDALQ